MTVSVTHNTAADGTFSASGAAAWNEAHAVTGLAAVAETGAYSDLTGAPSLAAVATSGAYADLSGTPSLGTIASQNSNNVTITGGTMSGVTITGDISGNAATVTTNANLTGPVTSVGNATAIANGAISYTKLANGTDGELLTWDASGVIATVAVGTAGHVLTSNGAGAAPTFQAVSATDITVADTTDTTCWVGLWESQTGSQSPKSDGALTYNASTGALSSTSLAGIMNPTAVTTTTASINLTAGTLMTTPTAGAVEMDSDCVYMTTDAGNRGYVPIRHFIRANATRTLPNDTNENAIFDNPANGRITLETGTYLINGLIHIDDMSATSGNCTFDVLGAGTATVSGKMQTLGVDNNSPFASLARSGGGVNAGTQTSGVVSAGAGTAVVFQVYGMLVVTAAGTLIPSVTLATAAAAVVQINSHLIFERIGSSSVVSVGQWD